MPQKSVNQKARRIPDDKPLILAVDDDPYFLEKKDIPSISDMERSLIIQALESSSYSVPVAAKILGFSEATLYRKIKKFGLTRTFVKK